MCGGVKDDAAEDKAGGAMGAVSAVGAVDAIGAVWGWAPPLSTAKYAAAVMDVGVGSVD
eukprot:CAMPEP_0173332848 /NCGR_PEP_ID=MMETSP1144-20121109/4563_1 /TAXON_ID=483371 /ORGANISM="non described non described, Strain CCMP2298" /LENGTH=58 /DNA_ID=CAMNT_0014277743 /DNA_START=30 /DNA_END=203 /DNA_ORIENTATION=+